MTDHVYAGWLTEDELRASIGALALRLTDMILEAVDEVAFGAYSGGIELHRYESGCAFGPSVEIRWQRDGERFHTVIAGDVSTVREELAAHQIELSESAFHRQEKHYYLWGQWSEPTPEWLEASVPHVFTYPSPTGSGSFRRKMTVVEYINVVSGELEFYRFAGTREERL